MQLPAEEVCERARVARDARFDGLFFTGVLTTGIFCRVICPARTANRDNVRYFQSSAAALEAGFRPCLRCRPEQSVEGYWQGMDGLVGRALRLIASGSLSDGSVSDLARTLGVSSRHLDRVFLAALGVGPKAVEKTRRVRLLAQLIAEPGLAMTRVAELAGFSGVRRFNQVVRETWQRSPSELRRLSTSAQSPMRPQWFVFRIPYRPPFAQDALLDFLQRRALPGVEEIRGPVLHRRLRYGRRSSLLQAHFAQDAARIVVRIRPSDVSSIATTLELVRQVFDLAANPLAIMQHLGADPLLAPVISAHPGLRLPGAWDGFELAVRAILGQQIGVAAATSLAGRLVSEYGSVVDDEAPNICFPSAQALAEADLRKIGLTRMRSNAIRALAKATASGRLDLHGGADREAVTAILSTLPGVGPWTVSYIAMRALGDLDALPAADTILRTHAGQGRRLSPLALEKRAQAWRPWRSYATIHLWKRATMENQDAL